MDRTRRLTVDKLVDQCEVFEVGLDENHRSKRVFALNRLAVSKRPSVVTTIQSNDDRRTIVAQDFIQSLGLASLFISEKTQKVLPLK